MTKLQKKLATALASSTLLMQLFIVPVSAGITCTISGNGSDTTSTCDFASLNEVNVDQDNDMDVDNDVDIDVSTGDNEAEDNTGGDVVIETGDVDVEVNVETSGNTNAADVSGTSTSQDYDLEIKDNGTDSENDIDVDVTDKVSIDQDNDAHVDNDVDVDAETGDNEAEDNTGGDVKIVTGDVSVNGGVVIKTSVNANAAVVGGDDGDGVFGARIVENGSETDNDISLALLNEVTVDQDNDAHVDNDVDVDAETGDNEAEDNTGGDLEVYTGDVDVEIMLDTMANFNQADVATGFIGEVDLAIKDNGTDSDNDIDLDLTDDLDVDQDNDLHVDNDADVDAETGGNKVEDNTMGEGGDDPSIETGDASHNVSVTTSGNANAFGGDLDLEVDFDMSELMNLLGALAALLGL